MIRQIAPPVEAVLAEVLLPHAFQRWLEKFTPNDTRMTGLGWLLTYLREATGNLWGLGVWPLVDNSVPVGSFFVCDQDNSLRYTIFPFPAWATLLWDPHDWDVAYVRRWSQLEPHALAFKVHKVTGTRAVPS